MIPNTGLFRCPDCLRSFAFIIVSIVVVSLMGPDKALAEITLLRMTSIPANSQVIGDTVQFRPQVNEAAGVEFQYLAHPLTEQRPNILRDWGPADWDWDTSGFEPGRYSFQLRARTVGSTVSFEARAYKSFELVTNPPVSSVSLALSPTDGQVSGQPVVLTASSTPQSGVEYQFMVQPTNASVPSVARDWGDESWTWDTTGLADGEYRIVVRARTLINQVETYEAATFRYYNLTAPINELTLATTNMRSPQTAGVSVDFEAATEHASGVEYRFMMRPIEQIPLEVAREWGPSTWTWDTAGLTPGIYIFQVRARNIGSSSEFQKKSTIGFRLVDLRFEDVSATVGFFRSGESWGGAWGDVNNDGYPDLWATNHRRRPALYVNNTDGTFTNRVQELLTSTVTTDAHGTAWADFDNDGDQDLVQTAGGGQGIRDVNPGHFNFLYVNQSGILTDEAVPRGVSYEMGRGRGATWLDWNKDGLLDLFYTVQGDSDDPPNAFFLQQADGSFTDAGDLIGIPDVENGTYAVPIRNDIDGTHSLMVGYSAFPTRTHSGSQGSAVISSSPRIELASDVAVADFNRDLMPDVYIARRTLARQDYKLVSPNRLDFLLGTFVSGREVGLIMDAGKNPTFELKVPGQRLPGVYVGGQGLRADSFDFTSIHTDVHFRVSLSADDERTWGMMDRSLVPYGVFIGFDTLTERWTILTYNTDGLEFSSVYGSLTTQEAITGITELNLDPPPLHPRDVVLMGAEGRRLVENMDSGLEQGTASRSVVAGDFDNDMDIDVYVLESSIIANRPNVLYVNLGDGRFSRIAGAAGAEGSQRGIGDTVLMADYDVDGFLDLMTFNGQSEPPFNNGPDQLFRNQGNENNWLEIDLEGLISNRDAIGATVYIATPDGKVQLREQHGHIHAKGQNHSRIHVGLGKNQEADLTIEWPSGIRQQVNNLSANQVIDILEQGEVP